jgi:hypothetical protein
MCRTSSVREPTPSFAYTRDRVASTVLGEAYISVAISLLVWPPNLAAMAGMVATTPGGAPVDFEFGLNLILDGLERLRDAAPEAGE